MMSLPPALRRQQNDLKGLFSLHILCGRSISPLQNVVCDSVLSLISQWYYWPRASLDPQQRVVPCHVQPPTASKHLKAQAILRDLPKSNVVVGIAECTVLTTFPARTPTCSVTRCSPVLGSTTITPPAAAAHSVPCESLVNPSIAPSVHWVTAAAVAL